MLSSSSLLSSSTIVGRRCRQQSWLCDWNAVVLYVWWYKWCRNFYTNNNAEYRCFQLQVRNCLLIIWDLNTENSKSRIEIRLHPIDWIRYQSFRRRWINSDNNENLWYGNYVCDIVIFARWRTVICWCLRVYLWYIWIFFLECIW